MHFLSSEWLSTAQSLVAGVAIPEDRSCRLSFDVGDTACHLAVVDGRVASWAPGAIDHADVVLRWDIETARGIFSRELRGDDALRATTVVAEAADGTYVGTPAPLNLAWRHELAALPELPGATLAVQFLYRAGPFGDVSYGLRFEHGKLVEERLGQLDESDATVEVTYRAMALVRCGEMSIIDALQGGSVNGDLGPLAALAGILESPEFHAAEVASGRHAVALSVLGELDSDPTFATAMTELAASTAWS